MTKRRNEVLQNFIYILKTMYLGTYHREIMYLFITFFAFFCLVNFYIMQFSGFPAFSNICKRIICAASMAAYLIISFAWYDAFKNSVFSIERNAPILMLFELRVICLMIEMVKKHRKESY